MANKMYTGVYQGQETGAGANLDSGGAAPLPSLPIWSCVFSTCSHSRVFRSASCRPSTPPTWLMVFGRPHPH